MKLQATSGHLTHLLGQGVELIEEENNLIAFLADPEGSVTVRQAVQIGALITGYLRGQRVLPAGCNGPIAHGWAAGLVYMAWKKV